MTYTIEVRREKNDLRGARNMSIADATRLLGRNLAERVVVRVAQHEETALPTIIEQEVSEMLTRIADKQGWTEWPGSSR